MVQFNYQMVLQPFEIELIAVQGGGRRGCCGWGGVKGSREVWEGVRVIKKVKGLGWGRAHIQGPL